VLAAHDAGRASAIQLLAYSYGTPPNSDYQPYVDQRAAGDRFRNASAHGLFALREAPIPQLDFAGGGPPWASQVHDATHWMPSQVRNQASSWHGHRLLTGQELSPQEASYLGAYVRDYALVRAWSQACNFPRSTAGAWTAMLNVANDLNPGLDSATAAAWWQSVIGGRCQAAFSPVQKTWLALFAAVGGRRAAAAHGPAEWLLQNDPDLDAEGRSYATLAAVSANLALDRRVEAAAVLKAQRARLPASVLDSPPFRYATMALTAMKKPAPP